MAVGTDTLRCYEDEDVVWTFTLSDPNVTDITGWAIRLVVKATAAAADPPLLGPITCAIVGSAPTLVFRAQTQITLAAGSYVYSARRIDSGASWELATATLTVLESAYTNG